VADLTVIENHALSADEAKKRIATELDKERDKYEWSWNGYIANVKGKENGAAAIVNVGPSNVVVDMELPWAAKLVKGKVEEGVRARLRTALDAAPAKAAPGKAASQPAQVATKDESEWPVHLQVAAGLLVTTGAFLLWKAIRG
jgi:hypothetical protein